MQKGYQKLIEWYGRKEAALQAAMATPNQALVQESQKRLDAVLNQLSDKREHPLDSPAIRALIGEYEAVMKKLHQLESAEGLKQLMLSVASTYRHELVQSKTDEPYGEGASEFSAQAIEAFYRPA